MGLVEIFNLVRENGKGNYFVYSLFGCHLFFQVNSTSWHLRQMSSTRALDSPDSYVKSSSLITHSQPILTSVVFFSLPFSLMYLFAYNMSLLNSFPTTYPPKLRIKDISMYMFVLVYYP